LYVFGTEINGHLAHLMNNVISKNRKKETVRSYHKNNITCQPQAMVALF